MTDDESIQRVLEVEAFLQSCRSDDPAGAHWSRVPGGSAANRNLYHGSAGVALFHLELHRATGEQQFLDEAIEAADDILSFLDGRDDLSIAFYSGLPGYLFVLDMVAEESGLERFRLGAIRIVRSMASQATPLGAGMGWIEPMPFSDITGLTGDREVLDLSIGAAGAGLAFLYAHRRQLDVRALDWARQTADRLLEMATETPDGPNWLMMADMPFEFTAPNFAHGAAGVGYFLADLFRATGEQHYLDVAIAAAGFVMAHATPCGDGVLVCHTEEQPGLHYLGVCHGPPGTGRLMFLLHEITGDETWLAWIHANMLGLVATGAPEQRTRGLWQNFGQCCGDAGIGDSAISLHRATGRQEYLDLARRIEAVVLDNSDLTDGRRSWSQAEHRNRPDFVETQTGYMQGAAGIASFLLHLATIDEDPPSKLALPDSPFVQ